jgi:hypothetical protein
MIHRITIKMDQACKRCGKKGASSNGLCLRCITELLRKGAFDHIIDRHQPPIKQRGGAATWLVACLGLALFVAATACVLAYCWMW